MTAANRSPRDARTALLRGFKCRCPNCGQGKLFRAYLKVVDRCAVCGEDYSHQRADDAPAELITIASTPAASNVAIVRLASRSACDLRPACSDSAPQQPCPF